MSATTLLSTEHPNHERRRTRRLAILIAVIGLALAGGGWWISNGITSRGHRCTGLDATTSDQFSLSKSSDGAQCIGWTIGRAYDFGSTDPEMASIIARITSENQRVQDQADTVHAKPYVRVGVLLPMTSNGGSAMTEPTILHSLQGAYAAQMDADESSDPILGDPTPLVQLVLANEGLDQGDYGAVIAQLGQLEGGSHPLVAMTGLGISIAATPQAADALDRLGIPSIGAVLTADDMVGPELFKVSPSNHQYAQSLKAYLDRQPSIKSGYLVYDRNQDNYVRSLRTAFTDTFDSTYDLTLHSDGFNGSTPPTVGTPDLFSGIVQDVCSLKPDVLFYAGRDRDLQALIDELKGRGGCEKPVRPLVIATGTTGLAISTDGLDKAQIGVVDASATDPDGWLTNEPGTPANYRSFYNAFVALGQGFTKASLQDGYAIMEHDAVVAAVWAARKSATSNDNSNPNRSTVTAIPTSSDVRYALFGMENSSIPGSSGTFHFDELPTNDLWPIGKPVPVIRIGSLVAGWSAAQPYLTQCQVLKNSSQPGDFETTPCDG